MIPRLPRLEIYIVPRLYPALFPAGTIAIFPGRQFAGWRPNVGEVRWFCRSAQEWNAFVERLKRVPCPHCKVVGMLIRHGYLRGYDDGHPQRRTVRARRIFCSNRHQRRGCGRTFSVFSADRIRRLSLTTHRLWRFLQRAVADRIAAAVRAAQSHLSSRTWQRLWKRFDRGQSKIRTALSSRCPPPSLPAISSQRPAQQAAAHTLAHLLTAFPNADCPLAAFQHALQTCFV